MNAKAQSEIMALMSDGRERTVVDICDRLKMPIKNVTGVLGHMVRTNVILSERLDGGAIYWLPKQTPKPKAPPKPKPEKIKLSNVAALNVATIKKKQERGMSYEEAYASMIRPAVRKEGHAPQDWKKNHQQPQYHDRDEAMTALITANPGIGRKAMIERTGLTENQVSDSLQRLMKAGRLTSIRGNGTTPAKYYPAAPQQVAAE